MDQQLKYGSPLVGNPNETEKQLAKTVWIEENNL